VHPKASGAGSTIPITVRQLEALARLSESFAKMECKTEATAEHVDAAIALFTAATLDAANRGSGEVMTEDLKASVQEVEESIRLRVAIGSRKTKQSLLQELAREFERDVVQRAIHTMRMRGELQEKGDFSIIRVR